MCSKQFTVTEKLYKGKFAIVRLWPGIQNAESENIERFKITAEQMGFECIEINEYGRCVKTGERITSEHVDFAIHLHFSTPKMYDIFSFVALWNPLQFYYDWGYEKYSRYLTTHDDFLSCGSKPADDHVNRMILKDPLHSKPCFTMFHSLSQPIFSPRVMKRKLFYIGINWEKLTNQSTRHTELLKKLDDTDTLEIYGPRVFQGVNVWMDFKSYVDEIPFDGVSIIQVIAKLGVSLVFSSQAHRHSELMSNRLFESLAAGAVIICDENQFAKKHFGDTLLYVHSQSPTLDADVLEHLKWLNHNPQKAYEMACASQKIFLEKFSLDRSLKQIYDNLNARKKILHGGTLNQPCILVIFLFIDNEKESIENFRQLIKKQNYKNIKVIAVLGKDDDEINFIESFNFNIKSLEYVYIKRTLFTHYLKYEIGKVVFDVLSSDTTKMMEYEYFCVMTSNEYIHLDHFSSLVSLAENFENSDVFSTSGVFLNLKSHGEYRLSLDNIDFFNLTEYPVGYCRFLFRQRLLNTRKNFDIILPYLYRYIIAAFVDSGFDVHHSLLVTCEINCCNILYHSVSKDTLLKENRIIKDFYQIPEKHIRTFSVGERSLNLIKDNFIETINTAWPFIRKWRKKIYILFHSVKYFLNNFLNCMQIFKKNKKHYKKNEFSVKHQIKGLQKKIEELKFENIKLESKIDQLYIHSEKKTRLDC